MNAKGWQISTAEGFRDIWHCWEAGRGGRLRSVCGRRRLAGGTPLRQAAPEGGVRCVGCVRLLAARAAAVAAQPAPVRAHGHRGCPED